MDTKPHVVKVIREARRRIASQSDIGKGTFGPRGLDGAPIRHVGVSIGQGDCICAGMAIENAVYEVPADAWDHFGYIEQDAFEAFLLSNGIPFTEANLQTVAAWNDDPFRTKQDVLDAFDQTLAFLAA